MKLLTRRELAHKLSLSISTVDNYRRAGQIPCIRKGPHRVYFDYAAVRKALEKSQAVCKCCGQPLHSRK